jgi:hypothetical protein
MKSPVLRLAAFVFGMLVVHFIFHPERLLPFWWQTYSDPDGDFSLEFPSQPRASDQQVKVEADKTAVLKVVAANPNPTTAYFFFYLDGGVPAKETVEEELDRMRDGAVSKLNGALLDEQRIQVRGHQARDIQARAEGGMMANMRLIVDRQRIYILEVDTAAQQKVDSNKVQKFFEALKFSR